MVAYMDMSYPYWKLVGLLSATLLFGAGCAPPPEPPVSTFDISNTKCEDIVDARQKVLQNYQQAVESAAKTYTEARQAFSDDLNACLRDIWKGGPCDAEWKGTQEAAERAQANISSDEAYKGWKEAKAKWDACYGNYEAKQNDWVERNLGKERSCQEEFQAKVAAANEAHKNAVKAAATKRDADLAILDEIEKNCKKKTTTGGGSDTVIAVPGSTGKPIVPPTTVPKSACEPAGIPGSQGTPRTGRSPDFGPKDIAVELMTQVAEEVTSTPLPISAIDNQIFAGIVCVKIRSRIVELTIDESDADLSGQRATAIRLRKKLTQYNRALEVWCAIAEGKKPLAEVKKDVAAINALPSGLCKKDADCVAAPLCCSANTIAVSRCDTTTGACVADVRNCEGREVCMGPDNAQPLFDHCGPAHEGNWTYGGSKPSNWSHPQPGTPRVAPPDYRVEVRMNF